MDPGVRVRRYECDLDGREERKEGEREGGRAGREDFKRVREAQDETKRQRREEKERKRKWGK